MPGHTACVVMFKPGSRGETGGDTEASGAWGDFGAWSAKMVLVLPLRFISSMPPYV